MAKTSLTHSPHKPQTLREAIKSVSKDNDLNGSIIIRKVRGGYHALDGDIVYQITKPNGTIVCNCPDFKKTGTCAHLSTLIETFRLEPSLFQHTNSNDDAGANNSSPVDETSPGPESVSGLDPTTRKGPKPAPGSQPLQDRNNGSSENGHEKLNSPSKHSSPSSRNESNEFNESNESTSAATPLPKSRTATTLELPFRRDQIRQKAGMDYIDGATVIQRLNDALGTKSWSFELVGEPMRMKDEMVIRGRLSTLIDGERVTKEDIGAHQFLKKRNGDISSEGDTVKSAVTDCIKRCARQLGVGLHLYA